MRHLLLLCLVIAVAMPSCAIKWLAMMKDDTLKWSRGKDCSRHRRASGMSRQQTNFCKDNLDLMETVSAAASRTNLLCQHLFKDNRWNCSSILKAPRFDRDLKRGSREQAFVYALSSAVLSREVARACAKGISKRCTCGEQPPTTATRIPDNKNSNINVNKETFQWGGCADNRKFGQEFVKNFIDVDLIMDTKLLNTKPYRAKKALMNLHNTLAGRMAALSKTKRKCKCSGVSGSCTLKICWKQVPEVLEISRIIKERYVNALEVHQSDRIYNKVVKKSNTLNSKGYRGQGKDAYNQMSISNILVPSGRRKRSIEPKDIIYLRRSPDYCLADRSFGSMGTRGRTCLINDPTSGGCSQMCCDRGYVYNEVTEKKNCRCRYVYCCRLECNICRVTRKFYSCK